ncbi:MAG TPA: RNA methyltransferase [Acidimicrobiia bacterium]|nr:RNA methyltransferase [Acidimicrobiia bacterium]
MDPVRPRGPRNQRVVSAARLHHSRERRDAGTTLIEGPKLLHEALTAGLTPDTVFALPDDHVSVAMAEEHGVELIVVDETALRRLAGTETPRGPVAVIEIPAPSRDEGRNLTVAWGLGDPGNVGTLIRIAAAFGWDFGHTDGTADPWSPKVLRAGAGGHFRVGISPVASVEELGEAGLVTVATVVAGGEAPDRLGSGRYAVLVGEESPGLPPDVVEQAARKVSIPMPGGTESLNAAVAAAIVIYELYKYQATSTGSGSDPSNLPPT